MLSSRIEKRGQVERSREGEDERMRGLRGSGEKERKRGVEQLLAHSVSIEER